MQLDDDLAFTRLGIVDVLVVQALGAFELVQSYSFHSVSSLP